VQASVANKEEKVSEGVVHGWGEREVG